MPRRRKKKDPLLFIAYFTGDGAYLTAAQQLQESLDNLELSFEIQEVEDQKSWEKNARRAPGFIREMLIETYGEYDRLVYVDADSVVCRYPKVLDYIPQADVALYQHEGLWQYSTLYLRRSANVLRFLERWEALCATRGKGYRWCERKFNEALRETPELVLHELPAEYAYSGDSWQSVDTELVVRHTRLSKTAKTA